METSKSNLWDINTVNHVSFRRVWFEEKLTKEEAIAAFKEGAFTQYFEVVTSTEDVLEITGAEIY